MTREEAIEKLKECFERNPHNGEFDAENTLLNLLGCIEEMLTNGIEDGIDLSIYDIAEINRRKKNDRD